MHVAFDAVMLSVYLHPSAKPPKPVPDLPARIQLLLDELEASGAKIIIPTPVLSEFLVLTGPTDGSLYLSELSNSDVFDIRPLDTIAAIEASEMHRKAASAGDKKSGSTHRWQVVKVDRQFVAIAKVNGVSVIYSDDAGVKKLAEAAGMTCKGVEDLPAPPAEDAQPELFGDEDEPPSASISSVTAPPSVQSPEDARASAPEPVAAVPSTLPDAAKPQQQGSSPPATPPKQ